MTENTLLFPDAELREWFFWVLHNCRCGLRIYDPAIRGAIERKTNNIPWQRPRVLPAWKNALRELKSEFKSKRRN